MIVSVKPCGCCGTVTKCRHTGARWLCPQCWDALMPAPRDAA